MAKDILIENGDLAVENGDFKVGNSDQQNVELIMVAEKGHFKQWPLVGMGILKYLNSPMSKVQRDKFEKDLYLQLLSDGAKDIEVSYEPDGTIKADARYE